MGQAVTSVGAQALDRVTELEHERNQVDAKNLGLEYEAERNAITADLYNRRGGDAIAHEEEARANLARARSRILSKANRAEVRDVLDLATKDAEQVELNRLNRFMARERDNHFIATSEARIGAATDAIVADPSMENVSRQNQALFAEVGNIAKKKGWSVEQTAQFAKTAYTNAHVGAIEALLEGEGPDAAQAHYDEHKGALDPEQFARIEAKIRSKRNENNGVSIANARDAVEIFTKTGTFTPEYDVLADQAEATGTDRGKKLARDMRIVRRNADKLQNFQNQSLADQMEDLSSLRDDPSIEDARFLELAQKNFIETHKAASDGRLMELEAQRGLIDPVPLSDPKTREVQARQLSEKYGVPVPVFVPSEVDAFIDDIDGMQSDELAARYAELTSNYSPNAIGSLASQVEAKRPAHAVALGTAARNPSVASAIIKGERLARKDKELRVDADTKTSIHETLSPALQRNPEALAPYVQAVSAYISEARARGVDDDIVEDAIEAVAPVMNYRGRAVVRPLGMTEDVFENTIRGLSDDDLEAHGNGVPMVGDERFLSEVLTGVARFDEGGLLDRFSPDFANWIDGAASLESVGPGQYLVHVPGRGMVETRDSQGRLIPYVLNLNEVR